MQSTIVTSTKNCPNSTYPRLKADGGLVVLFTAPQTGVVVHSINPFKIGEYNHFWEEGSFGVFNDAVVLKN